MIKRLMIVIVGLFLVATPAFATNNLLDNNIAYYELEETGLNYADQTGSWPITNSQTNDPPSRVTGIINFGQSFTKSSTNDLVVPHDMLYDNINSDGNLTISGWVKGTNTQTNQIFGAFAADTYGQAGFINWFMYDGKVMVGGNDCANGGTTYNSNVGPAINDDNWHHVMIVYTNYNAQDVYIDGTYEGSTTNPYCVPSPGRYDPGSSSTEQKFGSNPANGGNSNQWSDYKMDEVGFWNTALNQTHATALYNSGSGLAYSNFTSGPYNVTNINNYASRYYKMEDTSGNLVDATGNQNGVATGISYGETGIIDNAIGFDGTSGDKVEVGGYPTNANGVWSSCTWVYATGSKAWENVWRADQTGVYRNVALQRTGDASGTYSDTWRYVFSNGFDAVGGTVNYNQWDYICTSNDGSTAKLYQNGVQVASSSVSAQAVTWNYDLTLGIRPDTGGEKYTGNMDEIAMFNGYTLTQADINFLYASGAPDSNQQYTFSTSAPNTNPTITAIADQQTNEDEPIPIVPSAFTIGDAEDPISNLTLSYTSSDTALINSTGSITFNVNTTTGVVDMLDITPNANAFGTSTIDVTVTDTGSLTNTTSFLLTVFAVNDAPTITPIANQTTTEGATLVINFNVTDVDNPYTDLTYSAVAGNTNLIDSAVFSNYAGTNQTLTLVAGDYGVTDINVTVQDLQPAQASTKFQYLVNCNTTANYYSPMNVTTQISEGTTEPVTCLSQTFNYNVATDILTYEWYDFGATMTDIELYVYDTTGNNLNLINQTTVSTDGGTQLFDYNIIYPNADLKIIAELTDSTRSPFVGGSPARILEANINQQGQLGSLFSDSDGIIYGVLILLLFITIGIASQSATLTLIFSILGLFIASKFVLKIPSEFIWITGALVVILLWLIAKLRTD